MVFSFAALANWTRRLPEVRTAHGPDREVGRRSELAVRWIAR